MGGRQITDAVLVANEAVDDYILRGRDGMLCKLGMGKTCDHVNWDFIHYGLSRMGFGRKWWKWINTCITITSFANMVDGGPSKFSMASSGLRQGAPLSHLLFIK